MRLFVDILLTLAVGGVFGVIFMHLKVPNGLRIGALVGVALLGIFFRVAWMPSGTKFVVQVIAGSLVGSSMERSDLKRLPMVIKPTIIMIVSFLILNLSVEAIVHANRHMD